MERSMEQDIGSIVRFQSGASSNAETKVEPSEPAKVEPTGESAAPPAAERDESGRFKSKEEPKVEAKAEPEVKPEAKAEAKPEVKPEPQSEKPSGLLAALKAEREKRQQAEQRLASLEGGAKADTSDFYEDPNKAVEERVNKLVAPIREKFFTQSMQAASKAHDDFEAAAEHFAKLLDIDPTLGQRWMQDEDPGEFIYRIGSDTPAHREAQAAKVKEQLSAKDTEIADLKAKLAAFEGAKKAAEDVPESLNRQPSGAVPARESDKTDIHNIVRFKSG
jgi:hypothetical protein